jgi:hypothetical protein
MDSERIRPHLFSPVLRVCGGSDGGIRQHQRTWQYHVADNVCCLHGQGSRLALLLNFCLICETQLLIELSHLQYPHI